MEFPESNIPESIFLNLSFEDLLLSCPDSEPVSIFLDEFMSVPFPDPVAEIIPEHSTEDRTDDREGKMISRPESSDEDHHIHPWDRSPDDRKRLDTSWGKSNQIVPISHCLNQFPHPVDRNLDPVRMYQGDNDDT